MERNLVCQDDFITTGSTILTVFQPLDDLVHVEHKAAASSVADLLQRRPQTRVIRQIRLGLVARYNRRWRSS